jgi:hypothetical protein
MKTLFPIPAALVPPASDAQKLFDAQNFSEAIEFCNAELVVFEKQFPARNTKPPQKAEPGSAVFQYYALTLILVDTLAATEEWKTAKEVLGKYRVRFPQDPWGFEAGAEVTRCDTNVKDQAAVERAIELLEGEAARLRQSASNN